MNKKVEKKFIKLLAHFKSIDADNMIIRGVVGSDDTLDRHGDRVNPKGWELENFKKNPVILLNHDYEGLPIAKAIDVKRRENKLTFDIQFSKTYDKAVTTFNLIKENILNAWSVGFLVLEWGKSGDEFTINKQELLELSLVTVPANPNALSDSQKAMLKSLEVVKKDEKEEKEEEDTRGESQEGQANEGKQEDGESDSEKEEEKEKKEDDSNLIKEMEEFKKNIEEIKIELDAYIDEVVEKKIKGIVSNEVEKKIASLTDFTNVKSDEHNAEDDRLLVLNALRQELKSNDKELGKTLSEINKLLKTK